MNKLRIGILCYNLDPSIVDLLNRLGDRLEGMQLKAFPLVYNDISEVDIRFPYRPTSFKGRFFVLNGQVPEGQLLSIRISTVLDLLRESDIVISMGILAIPALISALFARLLGKKFMTIVQAMPPERERKRKWFVRFLKSFALIFAHFHIIQTEATRRTLLEVYNISEEKMIFAPYDGGGHLFKQVLMEDPSIDRELIHKKFSIPKEAVVFTFVGTLIYLKGVDLLIEAFAKILSQDPNLFLLIVGPDGGAGSKGQLLHLTDQVRQLDLSDKVQFAGYKKRRELVEIYRMTDVFVLPSRKDVWPKVLVEAALAGIPIITTVASGASHELVRDGENGFIIQTNDADSLAGAMIRLLDANKRMVMGARSLEIVDHYINPEVEVEGILKGIGNLVNVRN